jgi:hypothetical protein
LVITPTDLVGTETLTASGTGSYNSKDVGSAIGITVSSATLANGTNGGLASNYSLGAGQTAAGSITAKELSATVAAASKVYDGTTTAAPVLTIVSGLVGSELVGVTATGTYNSKYVASATTINIDSNTLSDGSGASRGLASNYRLVSAGLSGAGTVTALDLSVSGLTANDKVYDANTSASLSGVATVSALAGDAVSVTAGVGTFDTKNVGTAKTVTLSGAKLSGADALNYKLVEQTGLTASIFPTAAPTASPTVAPTVAPTTSPTAAPTVAPTVAPTASPTAAPTVAPTVATTAAPTAPPPVITVITNTAVAPTAPVNQSQLGRNKPEAIQLPINLSNGSVLVSSKAVDPLTSPQLVTLEAVMPTSVGVALGASGTSCSINSLMSQPSNLGILNPLFQYTCIPQPNSAESPIPVSVSQR